MNPPRPALASRRSAELILEPLSATPDRQLELACRLVEESNPPRRLWFRFPERCAPLLTTRADPFVLVTLVYAMGRIDRLHVRGAVSDGLLANLADFQAAFSAFHGRPFQPIEYVPDQIAPALRRSPDAAGLTAFSGGVDSCFSAFHHTALSSITPKRPLRAALMMHGFDIPLVKKDVFARSATRSRELTDEAGLELITGATNLRELPVPWEETFATAVAGCLTFFQPAFAFGLVPSCHDWNHAHFENGSNPVTDPLLSSFAYQIVHDGARYGRIDKLRHLAEWPSALRNLRVCWQGEELDRNCCRCEKCIRTMLMLRVAGVTHADAFPHALEPRHLDRLVIRSKGAFDEFTYLLAEARRVGLHDPWIQGAARALRRNRRNQRLWQTGRSLARVIPSRLRRALGAAGHRLIWRGSHRPAPPAAAAPLPRTARS